MRSQRNTNNNNGGGGGGRGNGGGGQGNGGNSGGGRGSGTCRNRKTPDNARFPRPQTDKYCWTHGACNHTSAECQRQATGHQNTATFDNRMGGSNAYCNDNNK